ncbi:MAG TPA: agglutinin biogenesis protein MshP [Gammaproteobacteria bacterium]|nr:agglutinin biogenesis protein MshP [Gammaproteobacteria bacterium]
MRRKPTQEGFALVIAVFIITVMAALGAYILTVGGVQHQTTVLTVQQMRALNAARSGVEWATYRALQDQACPTAPIAAFKPAAPTLSAFTISVTCIESSHKISGDNVEFYVISATATAGVYGSADYVSRHVETTISNAS